MDTAPKNRVHARSMRLLLKCRLSVFERPLLMLCALDPSLHREEKGQTSPLLQHHAASNGEPQGVEEDHRGGGEEQGAEQAAAGA